ncbi:MAG: nucleoside deaminase [Desulfamplus sp.]|nr:nucleoside deaminase [Desulfamplus sp.]
MTLLKHNKYMKLALKEAAKALELGEFPVGCVIVFNGKVVASGSRLGTASPEKRPSEIDHAEIRALKSLEENINHHKNINHHNGKNMNHHDGSDNGRDMCIDNGSNIDREIINIIPEECIIYCTMEPCLMCFGAIILSGIKQIFYAFEDPMGGGTSCNLGELPILYRESGIKVVPYLFREESLKFFAQFFSRKNNFYWKNSFLEQYTLKEANYIIQASETDN